MRIQRIITALWSTYQYFDVFITIEHLRHESSAYFTQGIVRDVQESYSSVVLLYNRVHNTLLCYWNAYMPRYIYLMGFLNVMTFNNNMNCYILE